LTVSDILVTMAGAWKKVEFGGQKYLFKLIVETVGGYSCYLTDLVNLYKETTSKEVFAERFNEVNSDLEISDISEALKEVSSIINSDGEKNIVGEVRDDICEIKVDWLIDEIPYMWIFKMERGSNDDFNQQVTKSLLSSIALLLGEREFLVSVIRSKDLEIEDYENSGSKLTRKALKTTWFKPEVDLNGTKAVQIEDEIEFITSPQIQNIIHKTIIKKVEDEVDTKENVNGNVSQVNKNSNEEVKSTLPNLSTKRKIVKPDLAKMVGTKNKTKKSKLNSL